MELNNKNYDLIIIGGGPGGYVAAIRAAQLKMSVALVEKEHLGGVCLNWGCIPTKALLRSGEIKNLLDNSEEFGFSSISYKLNFNKLINRSRNVSKNLSQGVQHLMKKNKIDVFNGFGEIYSINNNEKFVKISLNESDKKPQILKSNYIIIATGAKSKNLPFLKVDHNNIWDYKSAMIPKSFPKRIVIVGSGAIGIEFASFYNDLGSKVTILESQKSILPNEDHEISEFVKKEFISRNIDIVTEADLINVESKKNVICDVKHNNITKNIVCDKLILAVGIKPNLEGIGLEKTKIDIKNGIINTNEWFETAESGIFAIGDVIKGPWLAHKASHEGIVCVDKINGLETHKINFDDIPSCTYSRPQVASIGLNEKQAKEMNYNIKVGRFPFLANGKAISLGETEGFVKTIFDKNTGELLGAHLVGPEVTELVQGFVIAKKLETTEKELMETIFPHPTLSEGMHESVLDAYNKVIHY